MKLWIIAMAISTLSACGHEGQKDDSSGTVINQTPTTAPANTPVMQQDQMQPPGRQDSLVAIRDSNGNQIGMQSMPNDPNSGKQPPKEKVHKRPKPVVIDFMK